MEHTRGPYPDELGFERWYDESPVFQKRVTGATTIIVNYLPNLGWGYIIVVADVVTSERYDMEWIARDAMEAALKALPESSW